MKAQTVTDVTQILSQIEQGDPSAAEQLLPLVYDELRKLAGAKLAMRSRDRRCRRRHWCMRRTSGWWTWRRLSTGTRVATSLLLLLRQCGGFSLTPPVGNGVSDEVESADDLSLLTET